MQQKQKMKVSFFPIKHFIQLMITFNLLDLNVEHAQVLLYLFHFLNLMQKKSVLLLMGGGILRCSEVARGPLQDSQVLHLSRLLLLFDYIMKYLYDAPPTLLEQVRNIIILQRTVNVKCLLITDTMEFILLYEFKN